MGIVVVVVVIIMIIIVVLVRTDSLLTVTINVTSMIYVTVGLMLLLVVTCCCWCLYSRSLLRCLFCRRRGRAVISLCACIVNGTESEAVIHLFKTGAARGRRRLLCECGTDSVAQTGRRRRG